MRRSVIGVVAAWQTVSRLVMRLCATSMFVGRLVKRLGSCVSLLPRADREDLTEVTKSSVVSPSESSASDIIWQTGGGVSQGNGACVYMCMYSGAHLPPCLSPPHRHATEVLNSHRSCSTLSVSMSISLKSRVVTECTLRSGLMSSSGLPRIFSSLKTCRNDGSRFRWLLGTTREM